jgi:hypothetical protein
MSKPRINISDKLKQNKKITEEFEVMLGGLTLEELIGLKIEVSARNLKGKIYGVNLLGATSRMVKDAALSYAINFCKNEQSGALLLGILLKDFKIKKNRYFKKMKMEELDAQL